jgi:hypothetical protein
VEKPDRPLVIESALELKGASNMLSVADVKARVTRYQELHGHWNNPPDAFAAWYLSERYGLKPQDAARVAPGGNHDFGLDAFYFEELKGETALHLIQAKFSSDVSQLKKGFRDFEKLVRYLHPLLHNAPNTEIDQNPLLDRLHAELQRRSENISRLQLHFEVLHLCAPEEEVINQTLSTTIEAFGKNLDHFLPQFSRAFRPLYPPRELTHVTRIERPAKLWTLRFQGEQTSAGNEATCCAGLGRLSDLVNLYKDLGDGLFEKNVRLYLYEKKPKSPAKHIQKTLEAICIAKPQAAPLEPEKFALFHNGITLHATAADPVDTGLAIRTPSVLNGCQTVKTAYLFLEDLNNRNLIDTKKWDAIPIPLRIVVTCDEDLVRNVTTSNNRQTEMSASAYRANQPEQIKLANRFAATGIFYERQEAAFRNLKMGDPRELEESYPNSLEGPINIEKLAQAIACATNIPLSTASRLDRLFEDYDYPKIFSENHLQNLHLLVFLTNLLCIMRLVLKDLKDHAPAKLGDLSAGRFVYPCARLMSRYIARACPDIPVKYGTQVLKSHNKTAELRGEIRKLAAAQNTGLQQMLPRIWRRPEGDWANPTDTHLMNSALRELELEKVDIFKLSQYAAA